MRQFSDCGRATYKLPSEIQLALTTEAARLGLAGHRVQGKKLSRGPEEAHVLAYMLARIFRMPEEQRDKMIREGIEEVKTMLESDRMVKFTEDRPFCHDGAGSVVGEPGGKPPSVKGLPARRHAGKDRGQGADLVPVATDRPDRRA